MSGAKLSGHDRKGGAKVGRRTPRHDQRAANEAARARELASKEQGKTRKRFWPNPLEQSKWPKRVQKTLESRKKYTHENQIFKSDLLAGKAYKQ